MIQLNYIMIQLNYILNYLNLVINKIIVNIIYSIIIASIFLFVGYLLVKLSTMKLEISLRVSKYVTKKINLPRLKFLRKFLYHIFKIFSDEEILIEKFFNNKYKSQNGVSFIDISVCMYTNIFDYQTTVIKTSSFGGGFKKEIIFRCWVSKYALTIYPVKSGSKSFNAEHYGIYPKRFELDRYNKFNNDEKYYVKGNRILDTLYNFYIEGKEDIINDLVSDIVSDTSSWTKDEKNGFREINRDQNINLI